jgi:hypothetical protein
VKEIIKSEDFLTDFLPCLLLGFLDLILAPYFRVLALELDLEFAFDLALTVVDILVKFFYFIYN